MVDYMEKIRKTTRQIEENKHEFYCDKCDKYLGASYEHDDGWYQKHGEFELKFYVADGWYRVKKCLCNDCRKKFISNVKFNLTNIGFEKD